MSVTAAAEAIGLPLNAGGRAPLPHSWVGLRASSPARAGPACRNSSSVRVHRSSMVGSNSDQGGIDWLMDGSRGSTATAADTASRRHACTARLTIIYKRSEC